MCPTKEKSVTELELKECNFELQRLLLREQAQKKGKLLLQA